MKKISFFLTFCFLLFFLAAAGDQKIAVSHIVTGDVVNISNGSTVRILCVDAPNVSHRGNPAEPYAKEAIGFMREEFEDKKVRLEFDEKRDDGVGRILAYIYREKDGMFLNAELIKRGFARVDDQFPCSKIKELKAMESEAQSKKIGIWSIKGGGNDKNQKSS